MPAASSMHWFVTVNPPVDYKPNAQEVKEILLNFVTGYSHWIVAEEVGAVGGKTHFHAAFILDKPRRSDVLSLSLHRAYKIKRSDAPRMIKLTYTRGAADLDLKLLEHAVVYCAKDGAWTCHGWDKGEIAKYAQKSEAIQAIQASRSYISAKQWWDRFRLTTREIVSAQLVPPREEVVIREACRVLILKEGYMPPGANKPHIAAAIALAREHPDYVEPMLTKVTGLFTHDPVEHKEKMLMK